MRLRRKAVAQQHHRRLREVQHVDFLRRVISALQHRRDSKSASGSDPVEHAARASLRSEVSIVGRVAETHLGKSWNPISTPALRAAEIRALRLHDRPESAIGHALVVEGTSVCHQCLHARIRHHLRIHFVAVLPGSISDPCEHDAFPFAR